MATKKTQNPPAEKVRSVIDRIAPISEVETPMSALLYGRSGTGKTAMSATFPKPLLVLDVREKGTETIANVPGIHLASVDKWSEMDEVYYHLKENPTKYQTVVIDQISQLQDLAMEQARKDDNLEDTDLLPRRVWGQISGMLKNTLFAYRDLVNDGINIVFIAHERANDTEDSVEDQIDPSIGPRLMPSVASSINGAVSVIGNTFIRERFVGDGKEKTRLVEYCLRIGPHAYYTTKIRRPREADAPPDVLVNPTYDKILALSRGASIVRRKVRKE